MTQVYSNTALEKGLRTTFLKYYNEINQELLGDLCEVVPSTHVDEKHEWLGPTPAMTEFQGQTNYSGLSNTGFTITNKVFTGGLLFSIDDMRRNDTQSFVTRVKQLAIRAATHAQDNLISTMVTNTWTCYDGYVMFGDSHPIRKNEPAVQDNNLATSGVTAALISADISLALQAMLGFKDEENKPFHAAYNSMKFRIVCAPNLLRAMQDTLFADTISGTTNMTKGMATLTPSPFVTASTWYMFRTDLMKPFIYQPELNIEVKEDRSGEVNKRQIGFDVSCAYGIGPGYWQSGIKIS